MPAGCSDSDNPMGGDLFTAASARRSRPHRAHPPRLTDGSDAAAAAASQGSPPPRTDAMASAAAVKVWAVLATLALLTVLQVSSSPTNIVDGQCSKTAKQCKHCFLVAIDETDSTRCKLIWYYEVGKHSCRRNYHNIVCKPGAIEPLGLYKLCIRKCTGMGSYFLYRHVSPRWEIVINSTNKTN